MKKYFNIILLIAATLVLFSCEKNVVRENALTESSEVETNDSSSMKNISEYAESIVNKTINPSIYLDYEAGINAKVYKWIKSDDSKYFTLAFIDENGEPIKSSEAAINVGANNREQIDNGMPNNIPKGDIPFSKGEGNMKEMPDGFKRGFGGQNAEVYQGVYINANITNLKNQTMLIYAPAEYFDVDDDGNVIGINYENKKNNWTAKTAPIIFLNECGGWRSSSPRSCETSYIDEGFVYVTCGARSRDAMSEDGTIHTGKAPMQMADLKSGVIELRANDLVIPGDKNKIISVGTSGGGQMSSVLGASGDMSEYFSYMYEAGTLGIIKNADGTYTSAYHDNIFAAQNYCPIADIENADLAYAWWWVDLVDEGGIYNDSITDFEKRLQELEANTYIEYLNSLNLNATHILLGTDGIKSVNPVKHYRNRSGTADEHTSFGVGYNILTAAKMQGIDVDYSLVWNMNHGSNEGTSTGTFIDWVNEICR